MANRESDFRKQGQWLVLLWLLSLAAAQAWCANASPTAIALSKSTVAESLPTGTTVGELSTVDPDGETNFIYSLVPGTGSTDNASFTISASTLKTASIFDHETTPTLSIRVRSTDTQAGSLESVLTISVQNLSERTTWDVSANPGIQAGNGNWGSDNFWTKNGTTLSSWPGAGNTAEFSGANGGWNVNVNGAMQADSLVFTASGYMLNGGTINLSGSSPAIVAFADATIASSLTGQYAKSGAAKLTLPNNNSGTWAFTHRAGTTLAKSAGGLGAGNVVLDGTGRILLGTGSVFSNPLIVTSCDPGLDNGALAPDSASSAEWSGSFAVNANCATGGALSGPAGTSGTLTLSGSLNMGGSATTIRQRSGTVVYKGGGGATNLELAEGTARLGANNGLPPNAVWTQPHPSYASALDLNGFNQVLQAVHSQSSSGPSIRNSSGNLSRLSLTGNVDTTFAGVISGNVAIVKSGPGRQTLSGANTFLGTLEISAGTLRTGNARALGDISAGTSVSGNGALDLAGQSILGAEALTIAGTGPTGAGALVNSSANTAYWAGTVGLTGNATIAGTTGAILLTGASSLAGNTYTLTLGGSASGNRLDAPLTGTGSGLTKSGSGTWTLTGQSTYTGATAVTEGTLCVRGSLPTSGAVAVSRGATLCGTGSAGGAVAVQGGKVAPGTADSIGKLSAQSADLSKDSASTLRIRLKATTKPGIDYDRLELAGPLILGGKSVLELDLAGLEEIGTATGVATAQNVSGQFSAVKVLNNPRNLVVEVSYQAGLVHVGVTRVAPSFSKGASLEVREDTGRVSIPGWAKAISAGSGATGQTPGFRIATDHPSLFSALPALAPDGTLSFTTAPDSNGNALVKIRLGASDNPDSSALDSFTISVSAVNDAPGFSRLEDITTASDSVERILPAWAKSIASGPQDEFGQKTAFRLSHTAASLYALQPTLAWDGTLRFTPQRGANGIDTLFARLGDDGGTANGGRDSSAVDTFLIVLRPLSLRIQPATLKILPGDTARFQAILSTSEGTDSVLTGAMASWSWTTSLGELASGRVTALRTGTTRVHARFQGSSDSALLVVAELDTTFGPSADSVTVRAGHGISLRIPPHTAALRVALEVRDSSLSSKGIAGADSAVRIEVGAGDTIRVLAPVALVPVSKQRPGQSPSVFWMDSAGIVHLAPSTPLGAWVSFLAWGSRTWWLGYDTVAPTVLAVPSSDSIRTASIQVRWSTHDNVSGPTLRLCLQNAGQAADCRPLDASAGDSGKVSISRQDLPLGGRYWLESLDSRNTSRTEPIDLVVLLDTLRSPWTRTDDRYDLLALPYVRGSGSAHDAFRVQWGHDDPRRWRAFAADSGRLQDLLEGDPTDAFGRSFWVRTRARPLTPWIAGHWTTPMSLPVKIRLEPGWNAVGNPLGFDLSWRRVWGNAGGDSAALIGPYEFDGASQGWSIPDTTMRWGAWRGAAILNRSDRAVELQVPSLPEEAGKGLARQAKDATSPMVRISVRASQSERTAFAVWMGVDRIRKAWSLPPGPHSQPQAAVEDPRQPRISLLSDVRLPSDSGSTWTLRVTGLAARQPLSLHWTRSGTDTASEVWIRDDKSTRWLPLSELTELAVGDEDERTFQVLVGGVAGLKGPRAFAVGVRGAALAWSLPDRLGRSHVRIEAFDPRGRRLALLVDEQMDPGSYGRALRLFSPTGQVLLVLSAGAERTTARWLIRP